MIRPVRVRYFIWVVVPALVYAAYLIYGLPHLAWRYTWIKTSHGYAPFAHRHYTSCTYWGPYGEFTVDNPPGGKCGWIRFYKGPEGNNAGKFGRRG